MRKALAGMVALAGLWLAAPAGAATGDLTYAGCLSDRTASVGCQDLSPTANSGNSPLAGAADVVVSPDNTAVYAVGEEAIVHLFRDAPTGAAAYDGCIGNLGNTNCAQTNGNRFEAFFDVEVRPTGGGVYASDVQNNAVSHLFVTPPGGQLVYDGCVSKNGLGGLCTDSPGNSLDLPTLMDFSADGLNLYVPSVNGIITRYAVLPAGQIVFGSCVVVAGLAASAPECSALPASALNFVISLSITPDGKSLYASTDQGIDQFAIAPGGGLSFVSCITTGALRPGCTSLPAPKLISGDVVSDNSNVYISGDNVIAHFRRDATTGSLTFADCVAATDAEGCDNAPRGALESAARMALSSDGGSLYATSNASSSLLSFRRRSSGRLVYDGCAADTSVDSCTDLPESPLTGASSPTVSPDGTSVYVTAGESDSISTFKREPGGPLPPLTVDIDAKSKLKLKKLATTATCSEACSITVDADGKARKKFSAKPVTINLAAGQATQIRVPLKKKLVRKLSGNKGKVTFDATATAFGETATDSDKSKLK